MFTGLVQSVGIIQSAVKSSAGRRIDVALDQKHAGEIKLVKLGDSVAIAGVCLTVCQITPDGAIGFDVVEETLQRTTLGEKGPGQKVNIELSLRAGDPIGGHFVQGHIDAVAQVITVSSEAADRRITFSMPEDCRGLIVEKGSVAIDGVSMTVAAAGTDDFSVAIIPTTWQLTTLGELLEGNNVNIETDILTRTVVNYLKQTERLESGFKVFSAGRMFR